MKSSSEAKGNNKTHRPRLFRFGLRLVFVILTVVAVLLAWTMKRLHDRKAAVASIHEVGGTMGVSIVGPEWLRKLLGDDECFYEPQRVSLGPIAKDNPELDDDILASVAKPLLAFNDLQALDIRRSAITDKSAFLISQLETVTHLRLSDTAITDDTIAVISKLPKVQSLLLTNTRLSDDCVDDLCQMTTLTGLNVSGTRISEGGINRLQSSLKGCKVTH